MKSFVDQISALSAANPDLSPEDLARRVLSKAPSPEKPSQSTSDARPWLDQAACLAYFDPDWLAPGPDMASRHAFGTSAAAISQLLRCSQPAGPQDLRVMLIEDRHSRIDALWRAGRLEEVLDTLPDTSLSLQINAFFVRILRKYHIGGVYAAFDAFRFELDRRDVRLDLLRDGLRMLNWLMPEELASDPTAQAVAAELRGRFRQAIARQEMTRRIRTEADRFVGREPLLTWLQETLFPKTDYPQTQIVAIHGMGGIGKSAILSKLVAEIHDAMPGLLVGWIDFDRPGLGDAPPEVLTAQIVEQMSAQAEVVLGPSGAREKFSARQDLESTVIGTQGSVATLADLREQTGLNRPILIVLDTLEERQRHGATSMSHLIFWIDQISRSVMGECPLGILVSGRAKPEVNNGYFLDHIDRQIDDLEISEAAALYEKLGHAPDGSARLAELSGNPLLIYLISRLVHQAGGPSVEDLTGRDGLSAGAPADALQSVIYDRILEHVQDKRARKLAYPGLVLRRVSPRLIQDVLAPVCLGAQIDENDARALFEALRREVWLVEEDGEDWVRHRSDVRRLMMRFLVSDDRVARDASEIHDRAAQWYAAEGDETEALYHRTMSAELDVLATLPREEAVRRHDVIGADIESLQLARRATLRARAGLSLSDAEIAMLPEPLWLTTVSDLGPLLAEQNDFDRAFALIAMGDLPEDARHWLWVHQTIDALVYWDNKLMDGLRRQTVRHPRNPIDAVAMSCLHRLRDRDWGAVGALIEAMHKTSDPRLTTPWRTKTDSLSGMEDILPAFLYGLVAAHASGGDKRAFYTVPEYSRETMDRIETETSRAISSLENIDLATLHALENMHRYSRLLPAIGGGFAPDTFAGASRFTFVPSLQWISEASALARESRVHLKEWGGLQRRLDRGNLTMRDCTEELATVAARRVSRLPAPVRRHALFGGTGFPEHRTPLRYALHEATAEAPERLNDIRRLLADLCLSRDLVVPVDLLDEGTRPPRSRELRDLALVQILHFADQCRLLPILARKLAVLFRDTPKIAQVADDLDVWDRALRGIPTGASAD